MFTFTKSLRSEVDTIRFVRLTVECLEPRNLLTTFLVTNLDDAAVEASGDAPGTLRQAVYDSNNTPGMDSIEFVSGNVGTVELTHGELLIADDVVLRGLNSSDSAIDAGDLSRVLRIDNGHMDIGDVIIRDLTIRGGSTASALSGAAIRSEENLTIHRSVITGNSVSGDDSTRAAGIAFAGQQLSLIDSHVSYSSGASGISVERGQLSLTNTTVSDNERHGIDLFRATFEITSSTVSGNGLNGLEASYGSGSIIGSSFSHNAGTGILVGDVYSETPVIVQDSTAQNNLGDGISVQTTEALEITNVEISGNGGDGFRSVDNGNVTVLKSQVFNNSGFGVRAESDSRGDLIQSEISSNQLCGMGLTSSVWNVTDSIVKDNEQCGFNVYDTQLAMRASVVSGNLSTGIRIVDNFPSILIEDSSIVNNSAPAGTDKINAAGIHALSSNGLLEVANSTISGNSSADAGGGIVLQGARVELRNSTVTNNSANGGAAGINNYEGYLSLESTIVSGNLGVDLLTGLYAPLTESQGFNLIGSMAGSAMFTPTDILGSANPVLSPLDRFGGPTPTHRPLPGSPVIDAGDPNAVAGVGAVPQYDQRGVGFERVADGRLDIGAIEYGHSPTGDFDDDGSFSCDDIDSLVAAIAAESNDVWFDRTGDGKVDLTDRDAWLAEAGNADFGSGHVYLVGDANLDGAVDGFDFLLWNTHKFQSGAGWCGGDFNADGVTDGFDFNLWSGNKFRSSKDPTTLSFSPVASRGSNRSNHSKTTNAVLVTRAALQLPQLSQPVLCLSTCSDEVVVRHAGVAHSQTKIRMHAEELAVPQLSWIEPSLEEEV